MTDNELDEFLISTLQNILAEMKDCANYIKDQTSEEYKEIQEEFDFTIKDVTELLKNVKTLDDLAERDDEQITRVYEYIEEYADNFFISSEPEQKEKDFAQAEKLEELLALFYDSDDSDEEFEDED